MWNRVMDVQQIEIFFFSDSRHFCCERECVRLMFEQRIRHHLDFMKTHALVEFSQTSWQCRRDEVDGVTACSEFFAEFGADDSATAVGGVYRDADVHCALKVPSTKYKTQLTKKLRQATLAIACLYLTLTHLLRGGQVRAGVYACSEFLAMNSATPRQLLY